MQVLHIVRKEGDRTSTVENVMSTDGSEGPRVLSLAEAEKDPDRGGQELLAALREADRVVCW
jgi:hypothetical protein